MLDTGWLYFLILVYLPCLWMVLTGPSAAPSKVNSNAQGAGGLPQ
jgi:hypothetical protein